MATLLVRKAGAWVPLFGSAPSPSSYPDSTNTGVPAGISLTAAGSQTISTANAVLDSLDISGSIIIAAANVVIKRCRIDAGGDAYCVEVDSGNVTIQDCEMTNFAGSAVRWSDYVALRCDVHSFSGDGFKGSDNTTLQDSWIHDFQPAPTAHADGIQTESGATDLVIQHNTIDAAVAGTNSAIFLKNDLGTGDTPGPVLIDNNLISGGNYTLYAIPGGSGFLMEGITVTNNHFVRGSAQYGAVDVAMTIDTWSGNVYSDNGEVITL